MPGLGLIILIILLIIIGFLTASFFGRFLLKKTESLISKIPLIKIFYKTIKQIIETIFKNNSKAFREVVLLEYPRKGIWVLGFTTGQVEGAVKKNKRQFDKCFCANDTKPNIWFFVNGTKTQLKYLDVKVDDAIKTIVSAGIIELQAKQKNS